MGVQCSALKYCQNPDLQEAKCQMLKSQQQWVRNLIESQTSQAQKLEKYFVLENKNQPSKGVIFLKGYYYQGELSGKLPQGQGFEKIRRFIDQQRFQQQIYKGTFEKGLRQGAGIFQNKYLSFDGQWLNGFPLKGKLLIKKENQFGVTQQYKIHSITEKASHEGSYEIKATFPDGSLYEGQIIKKKESKYYVVEGFGKLQMKNGDEYLGNWEDGKFNGKGQYFYKLKGLKYIGEFQDGKKEGKGQLYLNETRFIEGIWKKDKKEGSFQIKEKRETNEINLEYIIFQNDKIDPIQSP